MQRIISFKAFISHDKQFVSFMAGQEFYLINANWGRKCYYVSTVHHLPFSERAICGFVPMHCFPANPIPVYANAEIALHHVSKCVSSSSSINSHPKSSYKADIAASISRLLSKTQMVDNSSSLQQTPARTSILLKSLIADFVENERSKGMLMQNCGQAQNNATNRRMKQRSSPLKVITTAL